MKKIISTILTFLLVVIFAFSSASCQSDGITMKSSVYEGGTHQYNYTETANYVVQNGASDYKIVVPDQTTAKVDLAAQELQLLFSEATGVYLNIVNESSVTYSADAKFISLGASALEEQAGVSIENENLGYEGFVIKTVGENIFIAGNRADAILYGVYGFLELEFGFEQFNADVYTLDKNVTTMKLRNYDVVDIPDTKVRKSGSTWLGTTGLRRMRFTLQSEYDDYRLGPNAGAHTWNIHLSEETDYVQHPKWYSTGRDHMCYNAQGDPEQYELLIQRLTEVIKGYMVKYPDGYIFTLGHGDYMTWCNCDTCSQQIKDYGGSRIVGGIKLLNEVAKRVDEWLETEEGAPYDREYYLFILSYGMTLLPPAKYNEAKQQWEPYDQSVVCHERVAPWFAPLEMDHQLELYDKKNEMFLDYWHGWMAISDKMGYYTYSGNYYHIMTPIDMLQNVQQYYQLAAKSNAVFVGEDTITNPGSMTGWAVLRNYVVSKLGWNANADLNELIKKFFNVCYAEAADTMMAYYESYKTYVTHQEFNVYTSHGIYANVTDAKFWSKDVLDIWISFTEQAIKDIEFYKYVDPNLYQLYYDNITSERVSVQFLMIELFGDSYDKDYIYQMKVQCKEDCNRLGISKVRGSSVAMGSYFVKWGV